MRMFELIIIIIILLTLIGFIISINKKFFWLRFLPGLAIVFTILHFIFEEYHWQMFPVYIFTIFFFIISLRNLFLVKKAQNYYESRKRKILKIIGIVFVFIIFFISILPLILLPIFTLPAPSGHHIVGTKFLEFIDVYRPDIHTEDPDDFRSISLQIWYPAENIKLSKPIPYMHKEAAECWTKAWHIKPEFLLTHFSLVQTHSYLNAKTAVEKGPFPVILFSPSGNMSYNTSLFEELVSHGYVIVCIGHPHWCSYYFYESGQINCTGINDPYYDKLWEEENLDIVHETKEALTVAKNLEEKNGLQLKLNSVMPLEVEDISLWTEDYDFVIQEIENINSNDSLFNGLFDLDRLGVIGLSKGGAAAGQYCTSDNRAKAGVNLGGFMFGDIVDKNIRPPFLFMDHIEPWCEECMPINDHIYSKVENSAYQVQIKGAKHFNFTDLSLAGPFFKMIGLEI